MVFSHRGDRSGPPSFSYVGIPTQADIAPGLSSAGTGSVTFISNLPSDATDLKAPLRSHNPHGQCMTV